MRSSVVGSSAAAPGSERDSARAKPPPRHTHPAVWAVTNAVERKIGHNVTRSLASAAAVTDATGAPFRVLPVTSMGLIALTGEHLRALRVHSEKQERSRRRRRVLNGRIALRREMTCVTCETGESCGVV